MDNEVIRLLQNHLFINIFVHILMVLVYRNFLVHYRRRMSHHPKLVFFLCAFSSIVCMHYPITVAPGYIFDLRQVSFIFGSITGGPLVSLLLGALIFLNRLLIGGGIGLLYTFLVIAVMYIAIWYIRPYYWKQVNQGKLLIVSSLSLVSTLLIYLLMFSTKDLALGLSFCLSLGFFQLITVLFVFYIMLRTAHYFKWSDEVSQLVKTRVVSQIAASMSHEVRNPLTVIRGFVQLMADGKTDREKAQNYYKLIMAEIDRAVGIINDYLVLAKSEEDDKQSRLAVKNEVSYVLDVMTPYALLQGVEIESLLYGQGTVRAGSYKLRQALINLVKNGIEAMPNGGKLTVITRDLDGYALILIQDTGVGMTKEQLQRIGTPFFSTKAVGTGLGIMAVRQLVHSSGGDMEIKSELGKGTLFQLKLPLSL